MYKQYNIQNEQIQKELENTSEHLATSPLKTSSTVIGRLIQFNQNGIPLVEYSNGYEVVRVNARFSVALRLSHIGSEVVLLLPSAQMLSTQKVSSFDSQHALPVIIGVIQSALSEFLTDSLQIDSLQTSSLQKELPPLSSSNVVTIDANIQEKPAHIQIDGESLTLSAKNKITLECGDSKITLTKDGKIKIQGKYVISQAKRANRIRGGSVELN